MQHRMMYFSHEKAHQSVAAAVRSRHSRPAGAGVATALVPRLAAGRTKAGGVSLLLLYLLKILRSPSLVIMRCASSFVGPLTDAAADDLRHFEILVVCKTSARELQHQRIPSSAIASSTSSSKLSPPSTSTGSFGSAESTKGATPRRTDYVHAVQVLDVRVFDVQDGVQRQRKSARGKKKCCDQSSFHHVVRYVVLQKLSTTSSNVDVIICYFRQFDIVDW
jgi:hypothetical protein